MDFLNKAKKSISNAGRELGQKAGDMSTMAKMNLKIREKETISIFLEKLERLPELSKEELEQISQRVREFEKKKLNK